jgi:hypothetical protein
VLGGGYVTFWDRGARSLLQWDGAAAPSEPDQPLDGIASLREWVDGHSTQPGVADLEEDGDDDGFAEMWKHHRTVAEDRRRLDYEHWQRELAES